MEAPQTWTASGAAVPESRAPGIPWDEPWFRGFLTVICAACGISGYVAFAHGQPGMASALYVLGYLSGGAVQVREVREAFRRRALDVNFLMLLAAGGAACINQWGEGTVLLFLFSLSGTLEKYTLDRTARSIEALMELRPTTATVLQDGKETKVPVQEIRVGDLVRVHPAERVSVDGEIAEGESSLDESTLTGESLPVEKGVGQEVFAGTLNHRGTLLIRATRGAGETMLSKIVTTVREARQEKTRAKQQIERWERPYVFCVLIGSALATLVPWLFLAHNFPAALYHGMTFLVAASPCAVVISTPATILAALTRGGRSGVLCKSGAAIERLAGVTTLALDKTGTVTTGRPQVVEIYESTGSEAGRTELLRQAASVERYSEHSLGQAVVEEAKRRGLDLLDVKEFESHVGHGVHARLDGIWIGVGREEIFAKHQIPVPPQLLEQSNRMREEGLTALIVAGQNGPFGVLAISDRIRPEAAGVIARARALGIRRVELITGDHARVGERTAQSIGADACYAGMHPDEKLARVKQLKLEGGVCFVGDGVNDAPALAAADVGVAMGGAGTDVALETADIVLMKDNLESLIFALWLSRRARATVKRGLIFSFAVIGMLAIGSTSSILLPGFEMPLWVAVLCHEGSTVCAIFNGLYLLVEPYP